MAFKGYWHVYIMNYVLQSTHQYYDLYLSAYFITGSQTSLQFINAKTLYMDRICSSLVGGKRVDGKKSCQAAEEQYPGKDLGRIGDGPYAPVSCLSFHLLLCPVLDRDKSNSACLHGCI